MKKIIFSLILSVLCLGVTVNAAEIVKSGSCGADGNNLTWTLDSEGLLEISGTGAMKSFMSTDSTDWSAEKSNIKSLVINEGVTSIGIGAFANCTNLIDVTLADSIVEISGGAFNRCNNIKNITLPDSVTSIGGSAFQGCSSLESINIPDGITVILDQTFQSCSALREITIPDSVTGIGGFCFDGCTSLEKIDLGEGLTTIGGAAFDRCTALKSITIPKNVLPFEGTVFGDCENLLTIEAAEGSLYFSSQDGVLFNKDKTTLIQYPAGKSGEYSIPYGVKIIGRGAFSGCKALTNIIIPNSVTTIENTVFAGCDGLTDVVIPEGVTSISAWAFSNCNNLKSVTLPRSLTKCDIECFEPCESLTDVYYAGTEEELNKIEASEEYEMFGIYVGNATIHYQSAGNPAQKDIDVLINGEPLTFDVPPQLINGRTMVPLRKIFEKLGAKVDWYAENQKIVATRENKVITTQIGNKEMSVLDNSTSELKTKTLDSAPVIVGGRTLVPVRAISESFGYKVTWIAESRTVLIDSIAE